MSDQGHYQTLIIAGLGSIGRSMFAVGRERVRSFARVVAVDRQPRPGMPGADAVLVGDITDPPFLQGLLGTVPGPVLLLNLCAGIDNVRLRRMLAGAPAAYLDSGCCTPEGSEEFRFSRMMPYTLSPVESRHPHWICWGVNPGVVELVTRMLLRQMGLPAAEAEVTIFEHDGLETVNAAPRAAVGWCPALLVEEMLVSPSLVVEGGRLREGIAPGGLPVLVRWGRERVPCRVVGHEDIWSLGRLQGVWSARFAYGLNPRVMAILESRDAPSATAELLVPSPKTGVCGHEHLVVEVRSTVLGASRTLLWQTDHARVWGDLGVNGVQFQTCASLWLALHMLQHTRYGTLPGTWCASNLPLAEPDWREVESAMVTLGMAWKDADHLGLIHLTPTGRSKPPAWTEEAGEISP